MKVIGARTPVATAPGELACSTTTTSMERRSTSERAARKTTMKRNAR